MPAPSLIRPPKGEWWDALESYLVEQFRLATAGRDSQVGSLYDAWSQGYDAIPAEKIRKVPFHKASNFVVPITRMFVDTARARTQGMIWATNPLISVDGFPNEAREGGESYLDRKARYEWGYYKLLAAFQAGGLKYGTAVAKIGWESKDVEQVTSVEGGIQSDLVTVYEGPWAKVIPFEDFFCYPVAADELDEMAVIFHRRRYTEEFARRMLADMKSGAAQRAGRPLWKLTKDELERSMQMIEQDAKAQNVQSEAGIEDGERFEFQAVECFLDWEISKRHYPVVAVLQPHIGKLLDVYFSELPPGCPRFIDYRPYQRDGLFWGDSVPRILAQSQEEISRIHNERRDAASIANGPQFKKKRGTTLPNPSVNGYPGKVWEVEEMDDFDVVNWTGRLPDTMAEEQQCFQIAERLMGLDGIMQGMSQGGSDKKGIYNTGGTLAMMGQANSRQMTHIRDFRWSVSQIVCAQFTLQRHFGAADPTIGMFDDGVQQKIRKFMELAKPDRLRRSFFEVKASDPSANKEVDKANLLQQASILSQYGQQLMQMVGQYQMSKDKNPLMANILRSIMRAQHDMAVSLARAMDQLHLEGKLPDFERELQQEQQREQQAAHQQGIPAPGANGPGLGGGGGGGLRQIMAQLQQAGPQVQ